MKSDKNKDYITPTPIIDSDNERVVETAEKAVKDSDGSEVSKVVSLYYAVRDGIWYDPYLPFCRPEHFRASHILELGRAFCIGKAALLCALGRACGIPSRVGFADVRNHLATRELVEFLGSDIFVFHGYTEFYVNGKWVKATPAFNIELCRKHNVAPLEFNGRQDSVFHPYNQDKQLFMEYLNDRGTYADVPVDEIVAAMQATYGVERVKKWIAAYDASDNAITRDFASEEVYRP